MPSITILPIAEREARIAAGSRGAYQVRVLIAFIILGVTVALLWLPPLFGNPPFTPPRIFRFLTWITYAFCLLSGGAFTIDCISEEKRAGTLGLLFLTELRGYDIVLGKSASAWLNCFYGLIATFPILGLSLMVGGVSLGEFSRVLLALTTTLFLSLSLGMFISTVSRSALSAIAILMSILVVYGLGATSVGELLRVNGPWPKVAAALDLLNTRYLLESAFDIRYSVASHRFWLSSSTLIFAAFALLASASWLVGRTWRETQRGHVNSRCRDWWYRQKFGNEGTRASFRKRLLERNPIVWLSGRARIPCFGFMVLFLTVGHLAVTATHWGWGLTPHWATEFIVVGYAWITAGFLLHLYFLAFLAACACRDLAEDRRSGALELVTGTSLSVSEILRGHWLCLARRAAGPLVAILLTNALAVYWFFDVCSLDSHRVGFFPYMGECVAGILSGTANIHHFCGECFVVACAILPTTWMGLAWVGMWTAMCVRKPVRAPLAALAIVLLLPWIIFVPLEGALEYREVRHGTARPVSALALLILVGIGTNVTLSATTRWQLRKNFRAMATDRWRGNNIRRENLPSSRQEI